MPEEKYPLDVESVGSDTYIVMSKGHHDFTEFMTRPLPSTTDGSWAARSTSGSRPRQPKVAVTTTS